MTVTARKTNASPNNNPTTMDDLLAMPENDVVVVKKGDTVTGKITAMGNRSVRVDIGSKTEGIVTEREYDLAKDYIGELKVGDEAEVTVLSTENSQGQVLLSLKHAALDARWDYFTEALEKAEVMEAKGAEINKGGLIVVVNGVRGFVPSSQFGKELVGKFQTLRGKSFKVRAIEVDREKNRLIFSERHVSEEKELAQKEQAISSLETGKIYEGVVSGVMHFGLFVTVEVPIEGEKSVGHVEGLVHISEISWEKVNHPKDFHQVGDRIQVKVLGQDERTGKLNLSIKQLKDDPWIGIDEKYPVGTTLTGTVSRVESFGVFVNIDEGIDGLIHNSKLESSHAFKKDDTVTVYVESVSPDQKRMSLSPVMTERPVEYR